MLLALGLFPEASEAYSWYGLLWQGDLALHFLLAGFHRVGVAVQPFPYSAASNLLPFLPSEAKEAVYLLALPA